jgi:hypothetical protein
MTDEQIIEIAHKYLYHYDTELGQWEINEESIEDIIKFALVMYNKGICEGAYQQSKRYMEGVFDDD